MNLKLGLVLALLSSTIFAADKYECPEYQKGNISFTKALISKYPGEKLNLALPYDEASCTFKETSYVHAYWQVFTDQAKRREGYNCKAPANMYWKKVRPSNIQMMSNTHYRMDWKVVRDTAGVFKEDIEIGKEINVHITRDALGNCFSYPIMKINGKNVEISHFEVGLKVKFLKARTLSLNLKGQYCGNKSPFNFLGQI